MKKLLLSWVLLNFWFSGLLISQTYEDGCHKYKKANLAEIMGDKQGARKALEEAYKIFKPLASKNDYRSLIMFYLVSIKLGRAFRLTDDLFYYVKQDYRELSTVEQITFYGDDKSLILEKLRKIARQNEQKAKTLLDEAQNHAGFTEYQRALDKLNQAEKFWHIDKIAELKSKYLRLKREEDTSHIKKQILDYITRKQCQDALNALNKIRSALTTSEFDSLEKEIKEKWHDQLLKEAKKESKRNNYNIAINKCDMAYNIIPSKEARKLKRKIQKRINWENRKSFWVVFADYSTLDSYNMTILDYNYSANSNQYATVTESGSVNAEAEENNTSNYSIGLMRMFSRSFGIMATVSLFSYDRQFILFTDYKLKWRWSDSKKSASGTGAMSDTGRISFTPISLDLLVALRFGSRLRINLYGGPTLFLTSFDLKARVGYGGVWKRGKNIYPEWFPFQYEIKQEGSCFGGNAGIDLEYKIGLRYSAYVGLQYFMLPKKIGMKVIAQPYEGQFYDFFTIGNPYELANLPDYRATFIVINYKIHAGIKFHF